MSSRRFHHNKSFSECCYILKEVFLYMASFYLTCPIKKKKYPVITYTQLIELVVRLIRFMIIFLLTRIIILFPDSSFKFSVL
jgi:hypothetical protein